MNERLLNIQFPGKLVFGKGSVNSLHEELIALSCRSVLIITIAPLIATLQPFKDKLEEAGIKIMFDISIVQEPDYADLDQLMQKALPFDPDTVIGIGGGSVLDVAKLVAAQLGNEQQLNEYVGIGLLKGRKRKLICVPTTSGTGSEVSPNAILVDTADGQKKGVISPYLVPDIVYVDPLLTTALPPAITAATGLDALTHCMEAYTNKFALPFIDMYAYEGMRLIAANIVTAVINGADEEARTHVAMGSMLGGFCLGPVNTAAVHALSYPLGSMFHLAHGLSNALLLPYVMEYNLQAAVDKYATVAIALGCAEEADRMSTAKAGVERIRQIIKQCGIPSTLREAGVNVNSIPKMAADAMKIQRLLKNNPRNFHVSHPMFAFAAVLIPMP